MSKVGRISIDVEARTANFNQNLDAARANLEQNATRMQAATQRMQQGFEQAMRAVKLFSAVAAGTYALALRSVIRATAEQERVTAQLEQTLKSTGRYTPELSQQLQDLAANMQRLTTYSNEQVEATSAMLLTFTRIGGETFPRAQRAILDVATAMKMDLKSATLQVGKALNDPILGMTALSRSGIQFTEAQKAVVKQLVETGKVAEAQAIILEELETQFGGSAEAARNTLGGALEGLKNAFDDLKKGGGDEGVRGVITEINALTKLLSDPATIELAQSYANALLKSFSFVIEKVSTTAAFIKWLSEEMASRVYGVAGDDINRLIRDLDRAQQELKELEDSYKAVSFAEPLLGKIGLSEDRLDRLRGITKAREEVARLQKQVEEYYLFYDRTKTPDIIPTVDVPVVPVEELTEALEENKAVREDLTKWIDASWAGEHKWWEIVQEGVNETITGLDDMKDKFRDADGWYKEAMLGFIESYQNYGQAMKDINDDVGDSHKKLIDQLKTVIDGWGKDSAAAIADFAMKGETSFRDMIDSMIRDLLRMMIYQNITKPLFGFVGGLFANAHGNAFQNGNVIPFARGGIVSQPTIFPMARGAGLMGEAGPEAILPLTRIGGDLGVKADVGSSSTPQPMNVNVAITAVDAASFSALMKRNPGLIIEPIVTALTSQGHRPLINAVKGVV